MNAREQLAWAAGIIDGEGCFAVSRGRANSKTGHQSVCAVLKVSQAEDSDEAPEMLVRMQKLFGGRLYTHTPHQNPRAKKFSDWQISGFPAVQAVFAAIHEWLGEAKREQAIRALRADNTFQRVRHYSYVVRIPGFANEIDITKLQHHRSRRRTPARYGELRPELLPA